MTNPELEYNLAGGLLRTIREKDFVDLYDKLVESGYRMACVLPFRALEKESGIRNLASSSLTVVHFEKAWNPTRAGGLTEAIIAGLLGQMKRFMGDKTEPPILQDSLFPDVATCQRVFEELVRAFPEAKFISHDINVSFPPERLLVEINPGINLSSREILDEAGKMDIGLVFDPSHLLLPSKIISFPGQPASLDRGEWEKQFNTFKTRIEVVDINGTKDDVGDLLAGKGLLKELADAARETNVHFLRVEIPLPYFAQIPHSVLSEKGFNYLHDIGQALR